VAKKARDTEFVTEGHQSNFLKSKSASKEFN